jgi:signal transduction histidine kinase
MEVFGAQAGTFERIITAQRDVTETICAREALASAEAEVAAVLRDTVERQEAERRRLARELHDCLGQHVAVIHMGLDEIIRQSNDDPSVLEQTRHLKATATEVSHEISRLAWELRPVGLDELGLETAIRSFTETISVRCGLPIDVFIAPDQRRLPPAVEATLYRVMQEAITNIVKHANASRSGIMLEIANGEASMVIEDDGCGFVWDDMRVARPGDRLGLLGMRERLSLVGGVLEIESAPGNGAALIIHVPLQCTEVQT